MKADDPRILSFASSILHLASSFYRASSIVLPSSILHRGFEFSVYVRSTRFAAKYNG
jgi:hypothetical protein